MRLLKSCRNAPFSPSLRRGFFIFLWLLAGLGAGRLQASPWLCLANTSKHACRIALEPWPAGPVNCLPQYVMRGIWVPDPEPAPIVMPGKVLLLDFQGTALGCVLPFSLTVLEAGQAAETVSLCFLHDGNEARAHLRSGAPSRVALQGGSAILEISEAAAPEHGPEAPVRHAAPIPASPLPLPSPSASPRSVPASSPGASPVPSLASATAWPAPDASPSPSPSSSSSPADLGSTSSERVSSSGAPPAFLLPPKAPRAQDPPEAKGRKRNGSGTAAQAPGKVARRQASPGTAPDAAAPRVIPAAPWVLRTIRIQNHSEIPWQVGVVQLQGQGSAFVAALPHPHTEGPEAMPDGVQGFLPLVGAAQVAPRQSLVFALLLESDAAVHLPVWDAGGRNPFKVSLHYDPILDELALLGPRALAGGAAPPCPLVLEGCTVTFVEAAPALQPAIDDLEGPPPIGPMSPLPVSH